MTKLQNFVFSEEETCGDNRLLFLINQGSVAVGPLNNIFDIGPNSYVSFASYFNSFSVNKWRKYCGINQLSLYLEMKGEGTVSIYEHSKEHGKQLLESQLITSDKLEHFTFEIDISEVPENTVIYIEIVTKEENFFLCQAYFFTSTPIKRTVNLGIITTTFRRENYIKKNLTNLKNNLLNSKEGNQAFLFIVDNGKSLDQDDHPRVSIIPNKNLGGAGGFSRGLIEVAEKGPEVTHIVFCDDDIQFIAESFKRLIYFYQLADNESLCIRGAMLRSDRPHVQHENGASLTKGFHFIPNNYNLDLTSLNNILNNEIDRESDYSGWWLFSFPRKHVLDYGYPIPAFIRWDDAEYSLRLAKHAVATISLNGIAVWHEPFEYKFSPALYYYEERNCFLARSIHDKGFTYFSFLKRALLKVIGHAVMYRYAAANHCLRGYKDALKGPRFYWSTDVEKLHSEILAIKGEKVEDLQSDKIFNASEEYKSESNNIFRLILSFCTLNGHLLPRWFGDLVGKKNKKVKKLSILSSRFYDCLGSSNVYYFVPGSQKGYSVKRSPIKYFTIMFKFFLLCLTSYTAFRKAVNDYNSQFRNLTSEEFWRSYLQLKE